MGKTPPVWKQQPDSLEIKGEDEGTTWIFGPQDAARNRNHRCTGKIPLSAGILHGYVSITPW